MREVTSSMMDLFVQAKWNTKGMEKKIESKIGSRFSKVCVIGRQVGSWCERASEKILSELYLGPGLENARHIFTLT